MIEDLASVRTFGATNDDGNSPLLRESLDAVLLLVREAHSREDEVDIA